MPPVNMSVLLVINKVMAKDKIRCAGVGRVACLRPAVLTVNGEQYCWTHHLRAIERVSRGIRRADYFEREPLADSDPYGRRWLHHQRVTKLRGYYAGNPGTGKRA